MRNKKFFLSILLCLSLAILATWNLTSNQGKAAAAPEEPDIYYGSIHGGCYISEPGVCKLHVDPFTINIKSGYRLVLFMLQANGKTIYDFRTDKSFPPPTSGSTYNPSLVMQDFAAQCGKAYTITLVGKDTSQDQIYILGETASFTCPASIP